MASPDTAARIAAQFTHGTIVRAEPLGRGLINDTFLVVAESRRFVLQRLNRRVFPEPAQVMANLRVLSDHVRHDEAAPLRLPELLATRDGADFHRDDAGEFWRALGYLESTQTLPALANPEQAEEVGRALGRFHVLAGGIAPERLHDTLPGFHVAPDYLARLDAVVAEQPRRVPGTAELREALAFVETRRAGVAVLEEAKQQGKLKVRVIHGDPKLDNVLFDGEGRRAVGLVDLDTVKPGLIHYDLGDCLRSCCNRHGEQAPETGVTFDLERCRAILRGYLAEARELMTAADRAHLYDAIRLLPLELGLRFLADHLAGDVYFKVAAPGQNLRRARVQFHLTASVERQEDRIRALIDDLN